MRDLIRIYAFVLALTAITGRAEEYFAESFSAYNLFDLEGISITYTPDGLNGYTAEAVRITELPTDVVNFINLAMFDDSFLEVDLETPFTFYGIEYDELFIGSNGYITFGEGDTSLYGSISSHYSLPRISTMYTDLKDTTTSGHVAVQLLSNRFVLTFWNVREYANTDTVTFQTELFYVDGSIRMSWLNVDNLDISAVVGLSDGMGTPSDFSYPNLTTLIADWDEDGILDSWERIHFGSISNCVATDNYDNDMLDNISEYICGTDPKDDASFFTASITSSQAGPVIQWTSLPGRRYSLSKSELVYGSMTPFGSDMFFPQNAYTSTVSDVTAFFKVSVEMDD